jgi:hypothetical protein
MCARLGRLTEADRYIELAHRCWRKAASSDIVRELDEMRGDGVGVVGN